MLALPPASVEESRIRVVDEKVPAGQIVPRSDVASQAMAACNESIDLVPHCVERPDPCALGRSVAKSVGLENLSRRGRVGLSPYVLELNQAPWMGIISHRDRDDDGICNPKFLKGWGPRNCSLQLLF